MDGHVTITVGGWFDSLPPVTQAYVQSMVRKYEKKKGWTVRFADQRGKADLSEFDQL